MTAMPAASRPGDRTRVLSGIQPTGALHLGNYIGAVRQWVELQDTHDAFYCVVDLHALTNGEWNPDELRHRSRVAAALLLAAGLDPDRCTLFVQSHVPEHTQLTWVLTCLTGMGEASRMTQYKDRVARYGTDRIGVGMFTYPILQAADILIYRAARVPVGEDQRQHLELTRDLAQRFNHRFGDILVVPEPYILKATGKILDLQDPAAKMSKSSESQAGVIELLDEPSAIAKKVKRAVTDTDAAIRFDPDEKPGISNLLTIFSALTGRPIAELETAYDGKGYGALKTDLADVVVGFTTPLRERTTEWLDDAGRLDDVLAAGADRARKVAAETLAEVYDAVGFLKPRE
jgi:tryptophanyl-tRNA synthetase